MPRTLVTPPSVEPLELSRAKTHLRADPDSTVEDSLLAILIAAARGWAEDQTGRALITQTWRQSFDRFPSACDPITRHGWPVLSRHVWPSTHDAFAHRALRLGVNPVQSVTSVKYIDANGAQQTLATDQYVVDTASLPARILPAYGVTWPDTRLQANAVTVEYVAGYGDAPSDVPDAIKAAMLLALGDLYANREAQIVGTVVNENPTAKALLGPYRVLEAV